MSVIPCQQNPVFTKRVKEVVDVLLTRSHELFGITETELYDTGLFSSAIESIRGIQSATMGEKRDFLKRILNHLEDSKLISGWSAAGTVNRHDYVVQLPSGKVAVIEAKGCLDGNNTNIFERPSNAQEFIIWSVCQNRGSNPRKNVWSGIHTRLSAEIISKNTQIDGLIVWDMVCGSLSRPCPKLQLSNRLTTIGPYQLPPPCIYVFPATVPSVRNNPAPTAQALEQVEFLSILNSAFRGFTSEINFVDFEVRHMGAETVRRSTVRRDGVVQIQSGFSPIKRS